MGYINRLQLYQALAKHFELPFITNVAYIKSKADKKLAARISPEEAMRYQIVPFRADENTLWVITTEPNNPETLEFLRSRFYESDSIEQLIITDTDFAKVSQSLYGDKISDASINGLFYRKPEQSARKVLSGTQTAFLCFLVLGGGLWLYLSPPTFFIFVLALAQVFYLVSISFKTAGHPARNGPLEPKKYRCPINIAT